MAAALSLLRPALVVALLLALVVGALVGTAWWLGRTEEGSRWLLARVPHVEVQGLRGALFGSRLEADRVRVHWHDGQADVVVTGFVGEGLRWTVGPAPGVWLGMDAERLTAREVVVRSGPPSGKPGTPPQSLALPLRFAAREVRAAEVRVDAVPPFRDVSGRAAISDGGRHHAEDVRFAWDRVVVEGDAAIGWRAPFAIAGELKVVPADAAAGWSASLRAGGDLRRIELAATMTGRAVGNRPAPAAEVQAGVRPWTPWPLAALAAQTEALDLAALASALPQTRLSGRADVQTSAKDAPIGVVAAFDNALPGRWDERRLPVRQLAVRAQALAAKPERVELREFDLLLGDGRQAAGRVRGRGAWDGHRAEVDATLEALRPQLVDGRAAAMTVSGPLSFVVDGLPSPDPRQAAATRPPWSLRLQSTLDGRLDAAPQPVQLVVDASADARRVEVREFRARTGSAQAQGRIAAQRAAGGDWQIGSAGSLADFDPLPWWPGEAGSAWRQGPHRLSAQWQFEVRVPVAWPRLAPLELAQRLAGSGTLALRDSLLAGVPLALDLRLGQGPSAEGTPSALEAHLELAGNTASLDARGNPLGDGGADRLQVDVDAPALAALAPLARLLPNTAGWTPRSGSAKASVGATGRWPNLRSEGRATVERFEAADLGVGRAAMDWRVAFDAEGRRPLELKAEAAALRLGRQRVQALRADLGGTLREHRLALAVAAPLAPPPLFEQLLGVRALAGSRAHLQGEGRWEPAPGGAGRWQGRVSRLAVGPWDGGALGAEPPGTGAGWIDARDLAAELRFDTHGNLERVLADAGRLRLADAIALRWDAVDVDLSGARPNVALRADVESFAVAPLLARAQPGFGWRGDLVLGARVELRAAERFDADIVFERQRGDLQVADDAGVQTLGLTDLRLALAAHDGQWIFTQALAGRALGEMAGLVSVATTREARWPAADAPIEGVLDARVANLGIWNAWVPPGWRLAGELRIGASLGGRFGSPEYTGTLRGSGIAVRNLLQGVNVSGGEVQVALQGASARIERFALKGGDGTLAVEGRAEFGASPKATLKLDAQRFRVLGRVDRQLVASGAAEVELQPERIRLDGKFGIDEGLIDISRADAPALDDDVTLRRPAAADEPADAAAPPRPRRDVAMAVDVDLGERLRLRGRGVDTMLRGQLRLTTPGGRFAVHGTVGSEEGTYAAYGQKLEIERGSVVFSGVADNPRLDLLALRPNLDTRVGVAITGTAQAPRVRLYSDPDMSDSDKLSWLVLGRASDGLGRNDTALLQRAAVALLAGEGDAPTDALMRNLGLDELSFSQREGEVRDTVITLGKQLSRRWYVGYERGVNATTGTWQLIYRIAQRFTLRAQSGQENSLDVIWTWKFDDRLPLPLPPPMRKSAPATPP